MKSVQDVEKIKKLMFLFFCCRFFGFAFLLVSAKFVIFDLPSERALEIESDWPVYIVSVLLILIGYWGNRIYRRKLKGSNDSNSNHG